MSEACPLNLRVIIRQLFTAEGKGVSTSKVSSFYCGLKADACVMHSYKVRFCLLLYSLTFVIQLLL